jgi:hypothetical protein
MYSIYIYIYILNKSIENIPYIKKKKGKKKQLKGNE